MEEIVVFRFGNEAAFYNRLIALGLSVRTGEDADGGEYRDEERFGICSTPVVVDANGDAYMASRLSSEDANKFPSNDHNPAFTIVWRSGEDSEATYPEITVDDGVSGPQVRPMWRVV